MEDVIYTISPIDTPFITTFSDAQITVIRFSGDNKKVINWFIAKNKIKQRRTCEWVSLLN